MFEWESQEVEGPKKMKWSLKSLELVAKVLVGEREEEVRVHVRLIDLDDPEAIVSIIGEEVLRKLRA